MQTSQVKEKASADDKKGPVNQGAKFEKRAGVCYLQLLGMYVQGIPANTNYSVENIRIEMTYGQQKSLSRITTDL